MKRYDTYLFDLDGTVYLGDELIPGAEDAIAALKAEGKNIRYVTNNPTRAREEYASKLTNLGIATTPTEVFTSVDATVQWLLTNEREAQVYPIGEASLYHALNEAGISICEDPKNIDIVLASFDRTFEYSKLQIAFDALWYYGQSRLMSTNPDKFCPYPGGRGEPDAAAIVGAIQASTGVELERTFGKPSALLAEMALASVGEDEDSTQCLMVGDRLETDIAMGNDAQMATALVLTGDSQRSDLPNTSATPTWVLGSIAELVG